MAHGHRGEISLAINSGSQVNLVAAAAGGAPQCIARVTVLMTCVAFSSNCSYKLRIECMLLKEELEPNIAYLEPSVEAVRSAARGMSH